MFGSIQFTAWHDGGMFMGMHWAWWSIWIVTLVILAWAFFRMFADRSETRRRQRDRERAEEALRERFARGEIDDQEFEARMESLRRSRG
ncbi:MAG: SHOCT domain-containing protein [Gemmatimonadetes bacterium]|jgi:putative membrane protein|nr:SHOCT domain-containing protein [Gemmatimonadota bacterium]NNK64771.1 SHOCT domain-containing protein [Gemmatimonadota bacterium]